MRFGLMVGPERGRYATKVERMVTDVQWAEDAGFDTVWLPEVPDDFEVLEQALEHQKPERVAEALNVLDTLLSREKPKRSRTLAGKLRFLEETSDDAELRTSAARIRAKL